MATVRIFRQYVPTLMIALACLELAILLFSAYAGVALRFSSSAKEIEYSVGPVLPKAIVFSLFIVIGMVSVGLYQRRFREGRLGILVRVAIGFLLATFGLAMIFYIIPELFLGRGALGLALAIAFFCIAITRIVFFTFVDQSILKKRILVLGAGEKASCFKHLRRRVDQRGFLVIGFVPTDESVCTVAEDKLLDSEKTLVELSQENEVEEIVVAVDDRRQQFPINELLDCKMRGVDVIDLLTFFERETGKVKLDLLHPSWLIFSDGFKQNLFQELVKRAFDILSSLFLLLVTFPIIVIAAVAVFIEDGSPVLFRQIRIGQNARQFEVLKFRSMRKNAESDGKARWATANDARVTRVGSFIRKVRIDELPQIFNVLKGDMSFVGPRPERPEFVEQLEANIPYYEERHRVKPGITGWAQICYPYGASEKDSIEKLQFDLYYAKNHNILLDFTILLQTAEVVLFGKGR